MIPDPLLITWGGPTSKMSSKPPKMQDPTSFLLWKLRMDWNANHLSFKYSDVAIYQVADDAALRQVLHDIVFKPNGIPWKKIKYKTPKERSTLSVELKDAAYVGFLLDEKYNWRFSQDRTHLEIHDLKAGYYFDATCVWNDKVNVYTGPIPGADCLLAFFTAYGDRDYADYGDFATPFNLYVDLLEGGTRFTPITIDPDVGYPGGNTVDGGGPVPTSGHGHRDGHDGDQDSPEA